MNISLYNNVDTTNTIELYLLILVVAPITHLGHVLAPSVVLLVTY